LAGLRDRPTWLLPTLLLCGVTAAGVFLYFTRVDIEWFMDQALVQSDSEMSAAELDAARKAAPDAGFLAWSSSIGGAVGFLFVLGVSGLYYLLAGKLTGLAVSFRQGFSLACWSAMPALIGSLLLFVGIAGMSPQTPLESLFLANLDPMLLRLPPESPWKGFATSFSFLTLWTVFLAALGWKIWSRATGWGVALVVGALPSVLIYGSMIVRALGN
jgi:hypothetical protein